MSSSRGRQHSVGIIFTWKGVPLLQRRGRWSFLKNKPKSYPGLYQLTAHGGQGKGESKTEALVREVKEELGESFGDSLDIEEAVEFHAGEHSRHSTTIFLYPKDITTKQVSLIRLEPASGGLEPILRHDMEKVRVANPANAQEFHTPIAMFRDELEALKKYSDLYLPNSLNADS